MKTFVGGPKNFSEMVTAALTPYPMINGPPIRENFPSATDRPSNQNLEGNTTLVPPQKQCMSDSDCVLLVDCCEVPWIFRKGYYPQNYPALLSPEKLRACKASCDVDGVRPTELVGAYCQHSGTQQVGACRGICVLTLRGEPVKCPGEED